MSPSRPCDATGPLRVHGEGYRVIAEPLPGSFAEKACEPDAPAPAGAPAAAFPCQYSNNSIYRGETVHCAEGWNVRKDTSGRTWIKQEVEQLWQCVDQVREGHERKACFQLRSHVENFVEHWGRERSAFWTITDEEGIHPKEFAKRWNSFLANEGEWISGFLKVLEPQKNLRPHYHNLVAVPWDMKPDSFDWASFHASCAEYSAHGYTAEFHRLKKLYVESAPPQVRAMWKRLRKTLPRYGLGRSEFLPIRKGSEAISEYVGKYLDKAFGLRVDAWKGVRRFETDRRTSGEWRRCSRQFSWVSPGASFWRARLSQLGAAVGAADISDFKRILGPRWAYQMRGAVISAESKEWGMLLGVLRGAHGTNAKFATHATPGPLLVGGRLVCHDEAVSNLETKQAEEVALQR